MKKLPLSKGKFAIVDDEDFDWLSQWKWCVAVKYAVRHDGYRLIFMHHVIAGRISGFEIDHRDGDGLNNQRENLRMATRSENNMNRGVFVKNGKNSSKFKGVIQKKGSKKWQARIRVNKILINLGVFETEILAASAYNDAAIKYFGTFSRVNIL